MLPLVAAATPPFNLLRIFFPDGGRRGDAGSLGSSLAEGLLLCDADDVAQISGGPPQHAEVALSMAEMF